MQELLKSFRIEYKLTQKIPYNKLSEDIQNIEFIKEDGYLIGFNITLNKLLTESDGEREVNDFANFLTSLLSIKSHRYVLPYRINSEFTRIDGNKTISGDFVMRFSIEGAPVNLDIKNEILSLKSFSLHILLKQLNFTMISRLIMH